MATMTRSPSGPGFSSCLLPGSADYVDRAGSRGRWLCGKVPGARGRRGSSGNAGTWCCVWPAMRSTMASAAARAAATWSRSGWPNTTPVIVVRLPSIQRMARKAKPPPAASVEPVLTPTNPWCPSNALVLCTVPATGSIALGVATMLANTGRRIARMTTRTWSPAVDRLSRRSRSGRCSGCGACPAPVLWHSSAQQTDPPSPRPIARELRQCCLPMAAAVPGAPRVRSIALQRRRARPTPPVRAGGRCRRHRYWARTSHPSLSSWSRISDARHRPLQTLRFRCLHRRRSAWQRELVLGPGAARVPHARRSLTPSGAAGARTRSGSCPIPRAWARIRG
jgi:hypothetical protein